MLRHHVQKSSAAAKRYYQLSDYMTEGQRLLPEMLAEAMLANARRSSSAFEVVERGAMPELPDDGQLLKVRYTLRDAPFEAYFAAISTPDPAATPTMTERLT